jgi:hypothetical protein
LLEAVWKPQAIAVIHCPAHTNQPDKINQGNGLVDKTVKKVALSEGVQKKDAASAKVLLQEEYQTSENETQTQVVGGKEEQASTWISPKWRGKNKSRHGS